MSDTIDYSIASLRGFSLELPAIARMPGGHATRVHHASWKSRSPRDLGAGWDFDDVRDHYLAVLFGVDPQALRRTDHDRYLALSRLASGEAMAAAFSQWRSTGSSCRGAREGSRR